MSVEPFRSFICFDAQSNPVRKIWSLLITHVLCPGGHSQWQSQGLC